MGIDAWSTVAASNNAAAPDGWPEGQAASTVNNCGRQMMASLRAWYEDAQWINLGLTPTRVDADTFTLTGDVTSTFHVGRRLKVTGSATGYATISATNYSAPNTTVDVTMDTGSLPVTLSAVYISILSSTNSAVPTQANPSWTTATGGSLTLSTPLGVASGGTGASSVAGARSSLSVSATGSDTTYSFRANNLSDLANAATARTNLGLMPIASTASASDLSSGTIGDARVPLSAVAQWQTSLAILDTQILTSVSTASGSFSLNSGHRNLVLRMTGSGTITLGDGTGFSSGDSTVVVRDTSGAVQFAAGGSQSIKSPGSRLSITEQNGSATATYLGSNSWLLSGV